MGHGLIGLKDQKGRGQINFMGRGITTYPRDRDPSERSSKAKCLHEVSMDI